MKFTPSRMLRPPPRLPRADSTERSAHASTPGGTERYADQNARSLRRAGRHRPRRRRRPNDRPRAVQRRRDRNRHGNPHPGGDAIARAHVLRAQAAYRHADATGLTRIGDKWHVAGFNTGYIYIFNDNGTYARRIKTPPVSIRGLTTDGTNLIAISGSGAGFTRLYKWPPQANDATAPAASFKTLSPPGGGKYHAQGAAHDGANTWVTVEWGSASSRKYGLLNATRNILHRTNKPVRGLTYHNSHLYGLQLNGNGTSHLVRISTSATSLQPYTAAAELGLAEPPMNNWKVTRRNVGIQHGLTFRNSTAYGFNQDRDEVRQARQPSPERLFSLTPHIGTLTPRGLTRIGDKWHVAGFDTDYIHIFNDNGTYARRIKAPPVSIRGLTTDGTNLIAISGSGRAGFTHLYTWPPQANDATPAPTTPPPQNAVAARRRQILRPRHRARRHEHMGRRLMAARGQRLLHKTRLAQRHPKHPPPHKQARLRTNLPK